ncbi:hypothetical protein DFW101_2598 [Solidesulfovibrio carbinoliphilus subsp. oakridgensis]|uniref:Uncharacterized protein n=1 Tax=Solidesulfovibrio carbinoliphilus subsp. oakridgensis TaxID=694327 RepID=G7Q8J0_9BACT|nr:hypothetical protein [Solidesulfovibrio carbinoliphilus]EHJ48602.1 hypothetical protein DFW101_2598 [Solidesulfovibrio carbinoliphilus subsp. oakridgensis]
MNREQENTGVRVLAGLAGVGLPGLVAGADRLFFHAALYSNFARDRAMIDALDVAMARPEFERCDIVSLDPRTGADWWDEFRGVLRQDMPAATLQREFAASAAFLDTLASRHPQKVRLYLTAALPLAPILLVGDTVLAGHYLHGPVPAPLGLWLAVTADVADLLDRAETGAGPDGLPPAAVGAYRLVCECVAARTAARRLA